jgi:hypothetical protein
MSVKTVERLIGKSLFFLDVPLVRYSIIGALVLFMTGITPALTAPIGNLMMNPWVRLFMLLIVVYVGHKDPLMSLLLFAAFAMTAQHSDIYRVQHLLGGTANAANQLLSTGYGAISQAGSGVAGGASTAIGGVLRGGDQALGGLTGAAQQVIGGTAVAAGNLTDSVYRGVTGYGS